MFFKMKYIPIIAGLLAILVISIGMIIYGFIERKIDLAFFGIIFTIAIIFFFIYEKENLK